MSQLGVEPSASRPASRSSPESPAEALSAVIDNASALARAELRLAAIEARAWLVRLGLGLTLLWLSLALFQVFALLLALSPILLKDQPWSRVGVMLLFALAPALAACGFAARELRRLKETTHAARAAHDQRS